MMTLLWLLLLVVTYKVFEVQILLNAQRCLWYLLLFTRWLATKLNDGKVPRDMVDLPPWPE